MNEENFVNTDMWKISLPDNVDLDVASKDLLLRLLEVEPIRRLRSVRTLEGIAFYKGYNFEDVKKKRINGIDLVKKYNLKSELQSEETFHLQGF